jgi:hypothetical protein
MTTSFAGTSSDDIIIPTVNNTAYRGGQGADTYVISTAIPSNAIISISDTEGANKIQLVDGLTILSSSFFANAAELTLSNGAKIQIENASSFSFDIGANAVSGDTATTPNTTYAVFAASLGVATLPTAGSTTPTAGTANYIVPSTSSSAAVTFSIADSTLTEPASATANMTFTVTLSAMQATATTVNYATSNGSANNAATTADYQPQNGTLTIPANTLSKTFTVPVIGDGVFDGIVANPTGTEVFTVTLSNPSVGSLLNATAKGTITDLQVNALPVNTLPSAAVNIGLTTSSLVPGISVSDANNNTLTVVLTANNGLISTPAMGLNNSTPPQTGVRIATLTGSVTDINSALAAMTYISDRTIAGTDTITVTTTDPFGAVAASTLVNINVVPGGAFTTATNNNFVGTSASEFYSAVDETEGGATKTLDSNDSLAASTGDDTLTITHVDGATALDNATPFTGVDNLNLTSITATAAATIGIDVTAKFDTSLKYITYTDGNTATADNITLQNVNPSSTVTLNSSVVTADIRQTVTPGALTVALGGGVTVTSLAAAANPATILNIQSNGSSANVLTGLAANATTATSVVNITGSQAFTMTTIGTTTGPLKIDGSLAQGKLTINNSANTVTATSVYGGLGDDVITGSLTIASTLNGNDGNDVLTGGTAADTISGGIGNDSIVGGAGADSLVGGAGNDTFVGGTGVDTMTGGTGKDTYSVDASGDKVIVVPGDTGTIAAGTNDVINGVIEGVIVDLSAYYTGAVATFLADGALANATAGASATLRDIYIDNTKQAIVIEMDATGTTTQEIYIGNAANATVANVGGVLTFGAVPMVSYISGNTVIVEGQAPTVIAIAADLSTTIPKVGGNNVNGASTSYAKIDLSKLVGGSADITGSVLANTIIATAGNDIIRGGAGADILTGGTGADIFRFETKATITGTAGVNMDTITDFTTASDTINFGTAGSGAGATLLGLTLSPGTTTAAAFAGIVDATSVATIADVYTAIAANTAFSASNFALSANTASGVIAETITFANGAAAGQYLVVNDSTAAFQAADDVVIKVVGTVVNTDLTFTV